MSEKLIGWECPRCRMIHSPYSTHCFCPPPTFTISGSSIGVNLFVDMKQLEGFEQKVLNETYKKSLRKKPTRKNRI